MRGRFCPASQMALPAGHRTWARSNRGESFQRTVRGRFRIRRRQSSKASKSVWVSTDGFVQHVVGGACELDGRFRVEILGCRIILGNDLQVDSGFVHFTDTQFTEVIELTLNRRILLAAQCAQPRRCEVLFERDDLGRHHDKPSSATASTSILKP